MSRIFRRLYTVPPLPRERLKTAFAAVTIAPLRSRPDLSVHLRSLSSQNKSTHSQAATTDQDDKEDAQTQTPYASASDFWVTLAASLAVLTLPISYGVYKWGESDGRRDAQREARHEARMKEEDARHKASVEEHSVWKKASDARHEGWRLERRERDMTEDAAEVKKYQAEMQELEADHGEWVSRWNAEEMERNKPWKQYHAKAKEQAALNREQRAENEARMKIEIAKYEA